MKIKVSVSMSRCSDETIRINVKDELSKEGFLEIIMNKKQFAEVVTGLYTSDIIASVRGLDFVGKNKIIEHRKVTCPIDSYKKEEIREWLNDNCKEEGWIIDDHLGSQKSIVYENGKNIINYSVYRYIDENN